MSRAFELVHLDTRQRGRLGLGGFNTEPALPKWRAVGHWIARADGAEFLLEITPQFFEIQIEVVAGPVLRERDSVAVKNFSARRRHSHGDERLLLLARLIFARTDDLHPP